MDFNYIIYTGAFELWKYFLNANYPISIRLIEEVISESDYLAQLERKYKDEYIMLKDKSIHYIEDFKGAGEMNIYHLNGFDFSLFDKLDTRILKKQDIDDSTFKKLLSTLWVECDHNYYSIVEYSPSFLKKQRNQLIYNQIFITYFNLSRYSNDLHDFISQELKLWEEILTDKALNFIKFRNELQHKVFYNIAYEYISQKDIATVSNIDFDIEVLYDEDQFLRYFKRLFESIQNLQDDEIKIKVVNKVKLAIIDRIVKLVNFPGAPNIEWLNIHWKIIGTGQGDSKVNNVFNLVESPTKTKDINQSYETAQEQCNFQQKRDDLKMNLENAGFLELELVKPLKPDKYILLINHVYDNKMPYVIAMFKHIGFLDHLLIEYKTKKEIHNIIASWLGSSNSRAVKGNIDVLNPRSEENRTRYTSHTHMEEVQEFYDAIK